MTVKQQVLAALESETGADLSGQALADQIHVTRAAVWKAIRALQEEGYQISAQTNRGYRLVGKPDHINMERLRPFLHQSSGFYQLVTARTLASTNDAAKQLAAQGAPEGTIVFAEQQTAGKGRMHRAFFSPAGTGIYMSLILRPAIPAEEALFITTSAAAAVAEAIESVAGKAAGIKWVNDVFCEGKKVCGILTEGACAMEDGSLEYAVLGIGINAIEPTNGFPESIREIAGAVCTRAEAGPDFRVRLMAVFLERFYGFYQHLREKTFLNAYRSRSILKGCAVTVLRGGNARQAMAGDIDDECRLEVRYPDGTIGLLSSGEISVRPNQIPCEGSWK